MLSTIEASLAAWADCEPDGYMVPEPCIPALLQATTARLPRTSIAGNIYPSTESSTGAACSSYCFAEAQGEIDRFAQKLHLHAHEGQVHFLYYWRAVGDAARLSPDSEGILDESLDEELDNLTAEIESVRDAVLDAIAERSRTLEISTLVQLVYAAAERSVAPEYWRAVGRSVSFTENQTELNLDELTVVLLSWLYDAAMWPHNGAANTSALTLAESSVDVLENTCNSDLLPEAMLSQGGSGRNFRTALLAEEDTFIEKRCRRSSSESRQCPRFSRTAMVLLCDDDSQSSSGRALSSPANLRGSGQSLHSSPNHGAANIFSSFSSPRADERTPTPQGLATGANSSPRADERTPTPQGPTALSMGAFNIPSPPLLIACATPPTPLVEPPPLLQVEDPCDAGSAHLLRTAMLPCSPRSVPEQRDSQTTEHELVGFPVLLHIYDVSQEQSIQRLNGVLAHRLSPLKLGGVFHAGVEVNGREWSFGETLSRDQPGVTSVKPMTHPDHHFRQTVPRGRTWKSEDDIKTIIADMQHEYVGTGYDLLRRNCCHFADDFCQRLGLGRIPCWVHRLARMGARIDNVLGVASNQPSRRERLGSRSRSGL